MMDKRDGVIRKTHTVEERFWKHVRVVVDSRSCWEWTGYRDRQGYGRFAEIINRPGLAHRTSYRLAYGVFNRSLGVLHHCDNPKCVRPSHLFLGTPLDNTRDAQNKGRMRGAVGSSNWRTLLNDSQVMQIREKHREGESPESLCRQFSVGKRIVHRIVNRETWRHV